MVSKTADCIDACSKTLGCRYWTVSKPQNSEKVECFLKSWKGRRMEAPGFVSGSLPNACCKYEFFLARSHEELKDDARNNSFTRTNRLQIMYAYRNIG